MNPSLPSESAGPVTRSATLAVWDPDQVVTVNPDIYGQYFEHVEDCVYPGVMDEGGLRQDVIAAAQALEVPVVRWPGGCFADVYHWRDGIGPISERPVRPNWHWGGLENNRFGTHEFLDWCDQVGAAPYVNVNLGTGDLVEALRWLDYTTGEHDTADVAERRRNGRDAPWRVAYWGIGNETWGSWEAGHLDAAAYGAKLADWAGFFRRYRHDVRIVAVGSHAGQDPAWDRTVLDMAGSQIDLLSLHVYGSRVDRPDGRLISEADRRALILTPLHFDAQIEAMATIVREHNATSGSDVGIAVDEWNIRHHVPDGSGYALRRAAPRTGIDALFAAGVLHAMIRHADLVRMANYVFLVNGNAVLDARNGTVTRSTLFPIFQRYRQHLVGTRLDVAVAGDRLAVPALTSGSPTRPVDPSSVPADTPVIDAVAVRGAAGRLSIAVINRSEQPVEVTLEVPAGTGALTIDSLCVDLADDSLHVVPARPAARTVVVPPVSCSLIGS